MNSENQELQMWHDFDKWLKEVAFGEEQYKVLMAEFYKDYGTTLEAGDTYTTNEVAEPIRHGRWEDKYDDGNWHCSVCGAIVEKDEQDRHNWNRCYHCGAKMDEVTE